MVPRVSHRQAVRSLLVVVVCLVFFSMWRLNHHILRNDVDTRDSRNKLVVVSEQHLHGIVTNAAGAAHNNLARHRNATVDKAKPALTRPLQSVIFSSVGNFLMEHATLWATETPTEHAAASSIHHVTLTCEAFSQPQVLDACMHYFRQSTVMGRVFSVVSVVSPGTLPKTPHRLSKSHNASFLEGQREVLQRLQPHAAKMKQLAMERLTARRQQHLDVAALVASLDAQHRGDDCARVTSVFEALDATQNRRALFNPHVRVLSGDGLQSRPLSDDRWVLLLRSAAVVVMTLDEGIRHDARSALPATAKVVPWANTGLQPGQSQVLQRLSDVFALPHVSEQCSFTAVHDVDDAVDFPVAVVVSCADRSSIVRQGTPLCSGEEASEAATAPNTTSLQWHPICHRNSAHALHLESAIKWGTKTAVFKGSHRGRAVAVKMFNIFQYQTFAGFFALVRGTTIRYPLINYPSSSCLDAATEAVYQYQPFLGKGSNLLLFMKAEGKTLPWQHRVELAVQLLCMFVHLHEHPVGVFTFDDNHPEQYYVREIKNATSRDRLVMHMVDIDTLQLAEPVDGTAVQHRATPRNTSQYRITCRCFYCHGRSDCLFINSVEGYKACGQWSDPTNGAADHEDMRSVSHRECDASNDSWFIAQLLYLIGKGSVAWQQIPHSEVVSRLQSGRVPTLKTPEPLYDALVEDLFRRKVEVSEALIEGRLGPLCHKYRCRVSAEPTRAGEAQCPAVVHASTPYVSPLI